MRNPLLLAAALYCANLASQINVEIYSNKDAVIGYHDFLNSENTNYNYADWYGALSQPGNSGGVNNSRSLIYFDLSAYPVGTDIVEVTLDFFGIGAVGGGDAASVGNIGANSCIIERITGAWSDNTVTWNTCPTTTSQNAVTLAQSTQTIQDYLGINVTSLVIDMINNPDSSHGFFLRMVNETPTRGLFFCGAGHNDPMKRPRLNVKYNAATFVPAEARLVSLSVHPNPATAGTTVTFVVTTHLPALSFSLVESTGRVAASGSLDSKASSIDLPKGIAPGHYFLHLAMQNGLLIASSSIVISAE